MDLLQLSHPLPEMTPLVCESIRIYVIIAIKSRHFSKAKSQLWDENLVSACTLIHSDFSLETTPPPAPTLGLNFHLAYFQEQEL